MKSVESLVTLIKDNLFNFYALLSIFIMLPCIGGLPSWCAYFIHVAYIILAVRCIGKAQEFSYLFIFYLIFLALTIVIGMPDPIFRSWERFGVFTLLFIFASPLLQSEYIRNLRCRIYENCIVICVIISTISFFCYFLNINLFVDRYEGGYLSDYYEAIGHFSGITQHSMLLGPIAGISSIFLLKELIKEKKMIFLFLFLISLGALLFAASRGAILATLSAFIVYFIPFFKNKVKNLKYMVWGTLFVIATSPFYKPYLDSSFNKHEDMEFGAFDSRSGKVEARISEFLSNPITGLGFVAIDPYGMDVYNHDTGSIEPGSSWLAILSMTGIIGAIFFLRIAISSYTNIKKRYNYLMLAYLSFFAVHLLVEGYIFSAGNSLSCFFWLTLAVCYDMQYVSCENKLL